MNYRRGSQRLYAVLTVVWVAIACVAYQWKAWPRVDSGGRPTRNAPAKSTFGDLPAEPPLGMLRCDVDATVDGKRVKVRADIPAGSSPSQIQDAVRAYIKANPEWDKAGWGNATMRYVKGVSIALIPPVFGYLILFQVVPWVWRGFGPSTQI
jgi:hypothetical protein